ncbi:hypothetical protein FKP32DRAFT_522811 [Trametes sanguinea]|nr:hypothetical protein FKP32DRAFT_522811 [Trametes sanguinea]
MKACLRRSADPAMAALWQLILYGRALPCSPIADSVHAHSSCFLFVRSCFFVLLFSFLSISSHLDSTLLLISSPRLLRSSPLTIDIFCVFLIHSVVSVRTYILHTIDHTPAPYSIQIPRVYRSIRYILLKIIERDRPDVSLRYCSCLIAMSWRHRTRRVRVGSSGGIIVQDPLSQ